MKYVILFAGLAFTGLSMTSCSTETTYVKKVPVYRDRTIVVTPSKRPPGDARKIGGGGVGGVGVVTPSH